MAVSDEADKLQARVAEIKASTDVYSDRQKKKAGVLLGVTHAGALEICRGLIKRADAARSKSSDTGENGTALPKPVHPESLIRRLSAHRTAAMAAHMLEAPLMALNLLCAKLAAQVLYERTSYESRLPGVEISADSQLHGLAQNADDLTSSKAWKTLEQRRVELRKTMPVDPDDLFIWLEDQAVNDVIEILCFCTASCINAVTSGEHARPLESVERELELDMAA